MQKKIIALAVAGLMVAPAAMAETTIYGKVRLSVDFNSNNDETVGNEDSSVAVSSHASRIGFKGGEDLKNGMKASWQIESEINMDDGEDFSYKLRDTYAGLGGDFGEVRLGVHDTPYKMAAKKVDVFSDTVGDYNAVVMGDNRADNVIAYLSPDFNGFGVAVAYVSSYSNDDLPQTEAEGEQTATSLSLSYDTGDLHVAVATETLSEFIIGATTDDLTYTKLGVTYQLDMTSLGFVYEQTDFDGDGPTTIYLSVAHKMGDTTLKAAVGQLSEFSDDAEDGGMLMALGVSQKLGENTEAYAIYANMSNDDFGMNGLKELDAGAAGESVSQISFGVNHNF